jgi:hypothetical protein
VQVLAADQAPAFGRQVLGLPSRDLRHARGWQLVGTEEPDSFTVPQR